MTTKIRLQDVPEIEYRGFLIYAYASAMDSDRVHVFAEWQGPFDNAPDFAPAQYEPNIAAGIWEPGAMNRLGQPGAFTVGVDADMLAKRVDAMKARIDRAWENQAAA